MTARTTRRRVGLLNITTHTAEGPATTDPEAFSSTLEKLNRFHTPAASLQRMLGWVEIIEQRLRDIPATAEPDILELAKRCKHALLQTRIYLQPDYLQDTQHSSVAVATAMEAAANLAEEWFALCATERWERAVVGTREGGRVGAKRLHAKRKKKIQTRNELMGRRASELKAAHYSRAETLRVLSEKYHVKPGTIERIPAVLKHLPSKRPQSSP